jgi:predicted methyltransferase
MRRMTAFAALALAAAAVPAGAQPQPAAPAVSAEAFGAALANANRDADRARDEFRHPAETLAFFRVGPDMKVGEYAPAGGWYSRVLGNYLSPRGKLVGLYSMPEEGVRDAAAAAKIRADAAAFAGQVQSWTGRPVAQSGGLSLDAVTAADKGSFDRIVVMRMMHNLMAGNVADSELKAMRDLLKPGGMLGIEQHRAKEGAPGDYTDGGKGYLRQKDVIGLVEAMGFELVAASEINANPRDTADHPEGVWEMKPSWRTKRAELENLGESDRMTLLFRKR